MGRSGRLPADDDYLRELNEAYHHLFFTTTRRRCWWSKPRSPSDAEDEALDDSSQIRAMGPGTRNTFHAVGHG
jgi:hypothetical protein